MIESKKDDILFGLKTVAVGLIVSIIALFIPNVVIKWIVFVIAVIVVLLGAFVSAIYITENHKALKKEGFLADSLKSSFKKKVQDVNYCRNLIEKIKHNVKNNIPIRLSIVDINLIFVDLNKAKQNLCEDIYTSVEKTYLICTLEEENTNIEKKDRFDFRMWLRNKREIQGEEEFYNILKEAFVLYFNIEAAPLESFTFLTEFERKRIIRVFEKEKLKNAEEIYEACEKICPLLGCSEEEVAGKYRVLSQGQRETIMANVTYIDYMRKVQKEAQDFLNSNSLDLLDQKAKTGLLTIKGYQLLGFKYLLQRRILHQNSDKQVQKILDLIVGILNYDPNEIFICGTGQPFVEQKKQWHEEWHEKIELTLFDFHPNSQTFSEDVEMLYDLTEYYFSKSDHIEADKKRLEHAIELFFEEKYKVLSQDRIIDFSSSNDYGLVPEKPIFANGADSANRYLDRLQTSLGERLTYKQSQKVKVEGFTEEILACDCYLPSGKLYKTLYVDLYGIEPPQTAPRGFKFV